MLSAPLGSLHPNSCEVLLQIVQGDVHPPSRNNSALPDMASDEGEGEGEGEGERERDGAGGLTYFCRCSQMFHL